MQLIARDGRVYSLRPGDNTIGRSPENAIMLSSISVSRHHAVIRWDNSGIFLMDIGSVNGTQVDGQRLGHRQWVPLRPGMRIQFGEDVICQLTPTGGALQPGVPQRPVEREPVARSFQPEPEAQSERQKLRAGFDLLFQAVNVSFSKDKLMVALGGSLATALALLLTGFLAFRLVGESLVLSALFIILGGVAAWLAYALTLGALTRMSYVELTGHSPVPIREALRYATLRWPQFAATPLALLATLIVVGLAEVTVMLVGRVDVLGELLVSLLFLPAFVLNLFLVVAWVFGLLLVFPIIVDRGTGITGTLTHLFKLLRAAPGQVILFLGTTGVVTGTVTLILWGLVSLAFTFTFQAVFAGLGGAKFGAVMASDLLGLLNLIPGLNLFTGFGRLLMDNKTTYVIAGRLLQFGAGIALTCALAFPLVLQTSLACAAYLNVKHEALD